MLYTMKWMLPLLALLYFSAVSGSQASKIGPPLLKSATFLSPPFFLRPGSVSNKFYFDIPFPKGHIALKSFNAEVVDENGVPVPLHETYLHHWVLERYYGRREYGDLDLSKIILVRNSGICNHTLGQYYGLGSETRRTSTWVPDPYGIEVGKPEEIPLGYEERWLLNIHAIDTRGVEDRLGCTECKCSLYNVTKDEYGHPIADNYIGGLYCCYDETQCRVKEGVEGVTRKLFLKYTVMWVDWDVSVAPVKIYIFDVTDTGEATSDPRRSSCKVEYEVPACSLEDKANGECVHTKTAVRLVMPRGGHIVYGVSHQHSGGLGSALYGEDGRLLCTSNPTYGEGEEAGNEANYIIGMSTCYPKPGSVKVSDGEALTFVSNYSSTQLHTGVMGLFYILVAEMLPPPPPKIPIFLTFPASWGFEVSKSTWALLLAAAALALIIGISYYRKRDTSAGYQSLVIS
ncbi:hypothetical protein ACMD2_07203 [Ananas comosus]|uniref:Stress up-regulated Nod 19 protein n=1 Tax=Ananas comosus TaxID=4615 RepID=A0A199VP00_ANACO|nr:hypothetical protein ACMD2_07203 [Ananas comosus]